MGNNRNQRGVFGNQGITSRVKLQVICLLVIRTVAGIVKRKARDMLAGPQEVKQRVQASIPQY